MTYTIFKQTGLIEMLLYLLENNNVNQKTIIDNTVITNSTMGKISILLSNKNLITIEPGISHNQRIYNLTPK